MRVCKQCHEPVEGKKRYCNDACRMAYKRAQPEQETGDQPEQTKPEQPNPNSLALPGDPDYVGVCEEVDGKWQVKDNPSDDTPTPIPDWRSVKAKLPGGVSQPTGTPTTKTQGMKGSELHTAVSGYTGLDWLASNEYAEICYRLITWTVTELLEDGQRIPQWKVNP